MGVAALPLRYPRQGELFRHFFRPCQEQHRPAPVQPPRQGELFRLFFRPSRVSFSRTAGESSPSSSFSSSGRNWKARAPRQLLPCRAFLVAMRRAIKDRIHARLQPLLPPPPAGDSLLPERPRVAPVPGPLPALRGGAGRAAAAALGPLPGDRGGGQEGAGGAQQARVAAAGELGKAAYWLLVTNGTYGEGEPYMACRQGRRCDCPACLAYGTYCPAARPGGISRCCWQRRERSLQGKGPMAP